MSMLCLWITDRLVRCFSCVYEQGLHASINWLDVRYWVRAWIFVIVDIALIVVSLVQSYEDEVARIYLFLAALFSAVVVLAALFLMREAIRERRSLYEAFLTEDKDKHGFLTSEQVKRIIETYPANSFSKIRRARAERKIIRKGDGKTYDRVECIDFKTLALARRLPRHHMVMIAAEFIADFLAFTSSLIIFRNGSAPDALAVSQGFISVLDLTFVVHSLFASYLSKYRARGPCCSCYLSLCYCLTISVLFSLAMSGFGVTIAVAEATNHFRVQNNQSSPLLQVVQSPGFWTGWVLSAAVLISFINLAILYGILAKCGCVEYRGRHNKLGKTGDSVQPAKGDVEGAGAHETGANAGFADDIYDEEVLSPALRGLQELRTVQKVMDKINNLSVVGMATVAMSTNPTVGSSLAPFTEGPGAVMAAGKSVADAHSTQGLAPMIRQGASTVANAAGKALLSRAKQAMKAKQGVVT